MKKLFRMLAVMMLAISMTLGISAVVYASGDHSSANASYESIQAGDTLTVAVSHGVNLRKGPGLGYAVIQAIPKGAHVYVMSKLSDIDTWIYVTYGNISAYVETKDSSGNFFSKATTKSIITYNMTGYQAKVLASSLNVRATPYITGTVLGYLSAGQVVDAIANTSNGWVKVTYYSGSKKITGYVSGSYVKVEKKSSGGNGGNTNASTSFSALYGCVASSKNESDLTVYASANTNSSSTKIDEAEIVYINAKSANGVWYRVSYYDDPDEDDDDDDEIADDNTDSYMETGYVLVSDTYTYRVFDKLKLSKTKLTVAVKGKKTLSVKDKYKFYSDIRAMGVTVKFTSNKKAVATVGKKTGVITGKKKGTAIITATVTIGKGNAKKTRNNLKCKVTVK